MVCNLGIDHNKVARLAVKRAIDDINISMSVSEHDRHLIFKELTRISKEISELDVYVNSNWYPLHYYDIGVRND